MKTLLGESLTARSEATASPFCSGNLPRLLIPFWVLSSEDVHCAVVTGHADEGCVLIEVDAAEK